MFPDFSRSPNIFPVFLVFQVCRDPGVSKAYFSVQIKKRVTINFYVKALKKIIIYLSHLLKTTKKNVLIT